MRLETEERQNAEKRKKFAREDDGRGVVERNRAAGK
jgi:hypothetical protein